MATAIERFRRCMRRHERRARQFGLSFCASSLRRMREDPAFWSRGKKAGDGRGDVQLRGRRLDEWRRSAWLYDHAEDAVARLRAEQTWLVTDAVSP